MNGGEKYYMSSYHTSFSYNNKKSLEDYNLMIVAFEPDNGFTDSFLSMDNISDDYYDGTKRFDYGSKYNTSAEIKITAIKKDRSDMTLKEFRAYAKWLTGAKVNSWLDMYVGDTIIYSFLGKFINLEQYKFDARTIGFCATFSSISPWAYSSPQVFDRSIEQTLSIDTNGVLIKGPDNSMSVNSDGILCNSAIPGVGACFRVKDDGTVYVDDSIVARIDNESDDLYSYIYLDIEFVNQGCSYLEINNKTLNEITKIDNLQANDIIYLTSKQFISAYSINQITGKLENQNKIFGDDFNFVWPRLSPGINNFIIDGNGKGTVRFTYRYPMKVGDCAMDISVYGGDGDCGNIASYDTIKWENIIGTPTTIGGYGITDAYTIPEVDKKISNINIDDVELDNMLSSILD